MGFSHINHPFLGTPILGTHIFHSHGTVTHGMMPNPALESRRFHPRGGAEAADASAARGPSGATAGGHRNVLLFWEGDVLEMHIVWYNDVVLILV